MGLLSLLNSIITHPLNRDQKIVALSRFFRWQIASRLLRRPVAVPFVNQTRLLVSNGMTGATFNIYAGLHEYEDMAFVLHTLRKEDLFVDIGANIGSYTILAGGGVGAQCVSIEPIPKTFAYLLDNLRLNDLTGSVTAMNIGIGKENGTLQFTSAFDTVNHVIAESDVNVETVAVPVRRLDDVLSNVNPLLMKIDVEGFETNVIEGADSVLSKPSLHAVLMELNGSGLRYGFDEDKLHQRMLDYGFTTYKYQPAGHELVSLDGKHHESGNTLYIRDVDEIRKRLANSTRFHIGNVNKYV